MDDRLEGAFPSTKELGCCGLEYGMLLMTLFYDCRVFSCIGMYSYVLANCLLLEFAIVRQHSFHNP